MPANTSRRWYAERLGKDLGECLSLEIEIGACVAHGGRNAGMAEPLADGGEFDTGFQEVDSRSVPQGVRMDLPALGRGSVVR